MGPKETALPPPPSPGRSVFHYLVANLLALKWRRLQVPAVLRTFASLQRWLDPEPSRNQRLSTGGRSFARRVT
jgi:hypothetical protein